MITHRWWANLVRDEVPQLARAALLQSATGVSGIALLATSAWLIATAADRPSVAALGVAIVGVRFFGLARGVSRYVERLATHRATLNLLATLQARLFGSLVPLGPSWLSGKRRGDVFATLVADVESLDGLFVRVIVPSASSALVALFVLGLLGWYGWSLALIAGAGLLMVGVVFPMLFGWLGRRAGEGGVARRAALIDGLGDFVHGLGDLVVFDRSHRQLRRVLRLNRQLAGTQSSAGLLTATGSALSVLVSDTTSIGVLAAAAGLVEQGKIGHVHVAVVVVATMASFEMAQSLAAAFQGLGGYAAAARRIRSLILASPLVVEHSHPAPVPAGRRLDVRALTFTYPGETTPVLADVGFVLEPGRAVAIVGASGCGKSTLVSLLARHWDTVSGMIEIDGCDIRTLAADDARSLLSIATQPVGILTGTLRENLAMAKPGASDAELMRVLDLVGLGPTVRRLPERLETWVGEHGVALSGGEQQRLAIARAMLRPAPFLILDEPTAHLDGAGEAEVLALVEQERSRRAVLLTSHRLSGLRFADEIVVLNAGRVVQRGHFDDLAHQEGWFRQMLGLQNNRVPSG